MRFFNFNPFGNASLVIEFDCDQCGGHVVSDEADIPSPDFGADSARDSEMEEVSCVACPQCNREFTISLYASFTGGRGEISELPADYPIEKREIPEGPDPEDDYYYDAISANTSPYQLFVDQIADMKILNDAPSPFTESTLRKLLFSGVITAMETYLSDTLINAVTSSPDTLKKFVQKYQPFRDDKISMSDLVLNYDSIAHVCRTKLAGILYHRLLKVSELYKTAFGINFGDIDELKADIKKRHDFVHRSGKTTDGVRLELTAQDIDGLISRVSTFIETVEHKVNQGPTS